MKKGCDPMKKILAFVLALVFVVIFAGCEKETVTITHNWGVSLEAQNVTATGLTIVCHQSGGDDVFELSTGSYYVIHKLGKHGWKDVKYVRPKRNLSWTLEAWLIPSESSTAWDVNWEWLYGKLPAGQYRIGKEISNFRGTGDFEKELIYAEFIIP